MGPLVAEIRADTGLSNAALGFLTTLPLLAFGFLSLFTSGVSRRFGMERTVALALVLIGIGSALRGVPAVAALYLGTALFGVGVALGNVLLPALAKRHFPDHSGRITGLYSGMMGIGATAAAGLSVPLAIGLGGWRASLAIWMVPAAVALLVWLPQTRGPVTRRARGHASLRALGRSPLAWQIALFMGLQSLTFYVTIAWLPDLLQSRGLGEAAAGGLLALSQATGVFGSAAIPVWAGSTRDQRPIIWTLGALEAASLGGLLLPGVTLAWLWVGVLGFVLGGTFALALTLLVLRSSDSEATGELSGMAQSVGYLVAATGPPLFGLVHDATGGWSLPLAALLVVLAGKIAVGLGAGRPGRVTGGSATG
ncbi:MAG: MFS transporter [Longimicrobiales bacterium]|nr:MFS transporter [Longimicrobiales bacterium]